MILSRSKWGLDELAFPGVWVAWTVQIGIRCLAQKACAWDNEWEGVGACYENGGNL